MLIKQYYTLKTIVNIYVHLSVLQIRNTWNLADEKLYAIPLRAKKMQTIAMNNKII